MRLPTQSMLRRAALCVLSLGLSMAYPRHAHAGCDDDVVCSGGPARIMIILDASSGMLNSGNSAAAEGQSDWDQFREVLAGGGENFFEIEIEPSGPLLSEVAHVGLIVFGDDQAAPGEQKVVIEYAPCTDTNLAWALDPFSSCAEPGCTDPWSGPDITWTFVDGSIVDPPDFSRTTISHMPRCEGAGQACAGSDRFTHLGIELAHQTQMQYEASSPSMHDDTTVYLNILVTDGEYDGFSTPQQVQDALEAAASDGIDTWVVGFGEGSSGGPAFATQLDEMAGWGGTPNAYVATSPGELQDALRDIVETVPMPCCQNIDCSQVGETGDTNGDTEGDTVGETDSSSDSDGLDDDGGCRCTTSSAQTWPVGALLLLALWAAKTRRRRA